jgi:predicted porin
MKRRYGAVAVALTFGSAGSAFVGEASAQSAGVVSAPTNIEIYGHLDLSIDDATKGIGGRVQKDGTTAMGKLGWQPDISSNLSFLGVRGSHDLGEGGLRAVFQIETQVDVAATPGPTSDAQVKGAWASRNSFLGMAGDFGAVKAGKTDAPYKLSTARMDPFSATVGDYNSIMGNTGGDNRAEFDTRVSHAAWYESPNFGGFSFSALYSPGQNRSTDNINVPSGESTCAGGNDAPCNDGSFGNLYSIAGVYAAGPLYGIAAYEKHAQVNRTGDEAGIIPAGAVGTVDEQAGKIGVQYRLPSDTTLNAIYERMTRNAPDARFNERQRNGYWLALTQKLGAENDLNLGWAHAGKSPGTPAAEASDGNFYQGSVDNASNMYTVGYKHHFPDKRSTWYAVYARQANHLAAHYDLGASGHGITTDCHDQNGNCFAGGTVQAVSVGMTYDF